jgi:dTMP kinase
MNVFIDVDPEVSMHRIRGNRNTFELYETLENLKQVRDKYLEAFEKLKDSEHVFIVDGNRSPEIIAGEIEGCIRALLQKKV